MKIAICFSGHIRNFFDKGIKSFNSNILYLRDQGHEVDIFFSVWSTYEPSTSHWSHLNYKPYVLINENLIKSLNPVDYIIEDYESIKHNFLLKNYYAEAKPEIPEIISEGILHNTPMFYKILSSNNLKTKYEQANNFKYDVVVRYRSQIIMDEPLVLEDIKPNTLYVPYVSQHPWENSCMTDDRFAYGDSEIMDKYSDVYNNLPILFKTYKSTGPERILDNWVVKTLGLNIQTGINVEISR
jgi:hypothetical protein